MTTASITVFALINADSATSPAYSGIAKAGAWLMPFLSQPTFGVRCLIPRQDKAQNSPIPGLTRYRIFTRANASLGITSLFDLVKSGLADLTKTSAFKPKTDDVVYGGDLTQVAESRQYACSLKICHYADQLLIPRWPSRPLPMYSPATIIFKRQQPGF